MGEKPVERRANGIAMMPLRWSHPTISLIIALPGDLRLRVQSLGIVPSVRRMSELRQLSLVDRHCSPRASGPRT